MLSYPKRGKFSNPAQAEYAPKYRVPAFFARSEREAAGLEHRRAQIPPLATEARPRYEELGTCSIPHRVSHELR
jgi:hypothetical protein